MNSTVVAAPVHHAPVVHAAPVVAAAPVHVPASPVFSKSYSVETGHLVQGINHHVVPAYAPAVAHHGNFFAGHAVAAAPVVAAPAVVATHHAAPVLAAPVAHHAPLLSAWKKA